jgi:DNA polymerase-1
LRLPGYEADDIIGTLAHKAEAEGYEVFMVSPDKDFGQLVRPFVHIYKPAKGGQGVEILGVDEICAKWEIQSPSQVIDILGLWGDASDNIPGVPGIGEKTAKKLIGEYGSMEALLLRSDELKGKIRENLETYREQALLCRRLATIDTAVPLPFEPDKLLWEPYDREALTALFEELEFRTLTRRVLDHPTAFVPPNQEEKPATAWHPYAGTPEIVPSQSGLASVRRYKDGGKTYRLIVQEHEARAEAQRWAEQTALAVDTETDSLDPLEARLVGISVCWEADRAVFVRLPDEDSECRRWMEFLGPALSGPHQVLIGHHLKYDLQVLASYGVLPKGQIRDTMLAHYLLDAEGKHGLDFLSEHYLHYRPIPIESLLGPDSKSRGKGKTMREVPLEDLAPYAAEDADIAWQLYQVLEKELADQGSAKLFQEVECPLVPVLVGMEREGIRLDTKVLKEFSASLESDLKRLEKSIHSLAGVEFNIASPKQLGEVLFEKLKLDPKAKKTKTGQYKTDEEVLSSLEFHSPVVAQVLEYREALKLRSTYAEALPALIRPWSGRIHTSYQQQVTATGRLSSHNPNLQNIPIRTPKGREIRKAFVAREEDGWALMSADYSQIELRLMAHMSQDQQMLEDFRSGEDIHAATAARVYRLKTENISPEMRRKAKMVNFGIIYGISAFGLSQRLGVGRTEAADLIKQYFGIYPGVKAYMQECITTARARGYAETLMGRRRYLRDLQSANAAVRAFAERNAINAPIQGSAADLIKIAMIRIAARLQVTGLRSRLLLQVHDELVLDQAPGEGPALTTIIREEMSGAASLLVPLVVEVGSGPDWLSAH